MRTGIVTTEDYRLTKLSAEIAEMVESGGSEILRKMHSGYRHSDSIRPISSDTERRLVEDRKPKIDERERRVMELRQEVSTLETQLAAGVIQDSEAIREKIARDRQLLSVLTAVPNMTDEIGRIR